MLTARKTWHQATIDTTARKVTVTRVTSTGAAEHHTVVAVRRTPLRRANLNKTLAAMGYHAPDGAWSGNQATIQVVPL